LHNPNKLNKFQQKANLVFFGALQHLYF
jgi:hypothetical protein